MTYPALMCLGAVFAIAAATAHAQSARSDVEDSSSHAEAKPPPIEPAVPATTLPEFQSDTASLSPLTQSAATHVSELAQLKAVTLLAVLPYFNSLAQLAQLSMAEKESFALRLLQDINTCETPACLVSVQTELNRILMDRVASLYKNVGWSQSNVLPNGLQTVLIEPSMNSSRLAGRYAIRSAEVCQSRGSGNPVKTCSSAWSLDRGMDARSPLKTCGDKLRGQDARGN
jgi:hypothetical protein